MFLHADEDPTLRKNIIVIFDDSGSMAGLINSRITRAKKATSQFIKHLPSTYNLGVYALNGGYVFSLQSVDANQRKRATERINALKARGTTPITKALSLASKELRKQQQKQAGYGSYTIVIVTDGVADNPTAMFAEVDRVIEQGITIKTIGIDINRHGLREVTDFVEASSVKQLVSAMQRAINAEVSSNTGFVAQDF
ncbi:VWA domain-containing protein [bacterium]|nr:VWA domain-containing protein [bacterium]MBU1883276.1 VWA domain-containing protein [bacterium]